MSENQEVATSEMSSQPRQSTGSVGKMVLSIVLLFLLGVSGFSIFSYIQLTQSNKSLIATIDAVKQQADGNQQQLTAMKSSLTDFQAVEAEYKKQAQSVNWPLAEAFYLTRLANHYLQLTHDAQKAFVLLQAAQDALQQTQATNLDAVRQAIATNITDLQSVSPNRTEEIYLQLATIYNQLDNLPLQPTPLQPETKTAEKPKDYSDMPWWQAKWNKSLDALSKVVIVRYTGATDMPLVMPEEKMFLYQNLHAQMEAAMMGGLQQNDGVYQVSLARLVSWIKKYYVNDAPLTTTVLQQLAQLQAVHLQATNVDLKPTLQLFDQYFAQNK